MLFLALNIFKYPYPDILIFHRIFQIQFETILKKKKKCSNMSQELKPPRGLRTYRHRSRFLLLPGLRRPRHRARLRGHADAFRALGALRAARAFGAAWTFRSRSFRTYDMRHTEQQEPLAFSLGFLR